MIDEEGDKKPQKPTSTTGGGDSPNRQRSKSIVDVEENDAPLSLTPDPKGKLTTVKEEIEGATLTIKKKDGDEGAELDDKKGGSGHEDGDGSGDEESQLDDKGGSDHEDGNGGSDHEEEDVDGNGGSELNDGKGGNGNGDGGQTGGSGLDGPPLGGAGIDAGQLLGGFMMHLAIPDWMDFSQIQFPKWDQIKYKAPDSVKNLLPENFKISPEMWFAGGAVTGTAISPTLHWVNDRLTGENKELSLFDYYSWNEFSVVDTVASLTSSVVMSYLGFHTMKMELPMTYTAGVAVTIAPQAFDLGANLISSSYNTITSLVGLSSSADDVEL